MSRRKKPATTSGNQPPWEIFGRSAIQYERSTDSRAAPKSPARASESREGEHASPDTRPTAAREST